MQAKFEGAGCMLSLATTDMLLRRVSGKQVREGAQLTADEVKKMVGMDVGPTRIKCVLLSLEALHEALRNA